MHNVNITLGGKEFELRLTFEAINLIEQRTGKGIIPLLTELGAGRPITFGETVIVLQSGIRSVLGNDTPSLKEIGELVLKEGLAKLTAPLMEFLLPVVVGETGATAGNAEETEEKKGN